MRIKGNKWIYLIVLSLIWGSSFILIKKSLIGLNAMQLGALRIIFSGIFLLTTGYNQLKKIKKHHWKWVIYSALLGSFFPVFLYSFAIKSIDSSIVSILNSITPFNALWVGAIFFGFNFKSKQITGIIVGLLGTLILIYQGSNINPNQNYWYTILPILSSLGYAFNINIIKKHLQDLDSKAITVGNFAVITVPAIIILLYTTSFSSIEFNNTTKISLLYVVLLAVFGTAIAKILFNKLIQISSTIFASSVTYLITIVAIIWGVLDNEKLHFIQIFAGIIILLGVWLINKAKK